MTYLRRWAINNGTTLAIGVFFAISLECCSLFRQYTSYERRYEQVVEIVKETLTKELSDTLSPEQPSFSGFQDVSSYRQINAQGIMSTNFDAFGRDLALEGHRRNGTPRTNAASATSALRKSGYIDGLRIALGALDEAEEMMRLRKKEEKEE